MILVEIDARAVRVARIDHEADLDHGIELRRHADPVLAVPATLAQADAVVSKTAPVEQLLYALRAVARGERRMPALQPDAMNAASARLKVSDLPIAGMLFSRLGVPEIAATLGISVDETRNRALRIIGELQGRQSLEAYEPELALR